MHFTSVNDFLTGWSVCFSHHSVGWWPKPWLRRRCHRSSRTCRASSGAPLASPGPGTQSNRKTRWGWSRQCCGVQRQIERRLKDGKRKSPRGGKANGVQDKRESKKDDKLKREQTENENKWRNAKEEEWKDKTVTKGGRKGRKKKQHNELKEGPFRKSHWRLRYMWDNWAAF